MHLGRSFGESFYLTNNLEYKGLFLLSSFLCSLPFLVGGIFFCLRSEGSGRHGAANYCFSCRWIWWRRQARPARTPFSRTAIPISSMDNDGVIYLLATKGRRMLSLTLSGEWCSVLPLVFAQALVQ
jgi:hypothetical protein